MSDGDPRRAPISADQGDSLAPTAAGANAALVLSGQQQSILEALRDKDHEAADHYLGALHALANMQNPVRIGQSAYSVRQLMDCLARKVGMAEAPVPLKVRINSLEQKFMPLQKRGDLDGIHQIVTDFFKAYTDDYPTRRNEARRAIDRLDPSGRGLPPVVSDPRVDGWMLYLDFFNKALHAGGVTEDEYRLRLAAFEVFVAEWFRPTPFADMSDIDSLIAEGPPNE